MTPPEMLTEVNVANQIAEIRAQLDRLCTGLSPAPLNWQADAGRRWRVGQCPDHVTQTTHLYGGHLETAIGGAPRAAVAGARAN